jgi:hypothetical protein
MDVRILISRTFQAQQFEPVKIEVEVKESCVDSIYEQMFADMYKKVEGSLLEAESHLRDIYCPPVASERKTKLRRNS